MKTDSPAPGIRHFSWKRVRLEVTSRRLDVFSLLLVVEAWKDPWTKTGIESLGVEFSTSFFAARMTLEKLCLKLKWHNLPDHAYIARWGVMITGKNVWVVWRNKNTRIAGGG